MKLTTQKHATCSQEKVARWNRKSLDTSRLEVIYNSLLSAVRRSGLMGRLLENMHISRPDESDMLLVYVVENPSGLISSARLVPTMATYDVEARRRISTTVV